MTYGIVRRVGSMACDCCVRSMTFNKIQQNTEGLLIVVNFVLRNSSNLYKNASDFDADKTNR